MINPTRATGTRTANLAQVFSEQKKRKGNFELLSPQKRMDLIGNFAKLEGRSRKGWVGISNPPT